MFFKWLYKRPEVPWTGIVDGRMCRISRNGSHYAVKVEGELPSLIGYSSFNDALEGCRKKPDEEDFDHDYCNRREVRHTNSIVWDDTYETSDKVAKHKNLKNGNVLRVVTDKAFYDVTVLNPLDGFIYENCFNDEEEALRACRRLMQENL